MDTDIRDYMTDMAAFPRRNSNSTIGPLPRSDADRNAIVVRNLPLAQWFAQRSLAKFPATNLADLVQQANLGLIKAAELFDPSLGFQFTTFAYRCMQSATRRAYNESFAVYIPYHAMYEQRAVSTRNGAAIRAARTLALSGVRSLSIFTPGQDEPSYVEDSSKAMEAREETAENDRLTAAALRKLGTRERYIVCRRYGLGGCAVETLQVIGRDLGITRERVRQIQLKALAKMRADSP